MSRTNSQAEIIFEEQLFPRANRLVIKKNNQRIASDSHITATMLRFVIEILRHHKLYNLMPPPDPNNTYTKPPSEIQILEFIKTLGYNEDPETKMISISKMVATRFHQSWRAILSGIVHFANLDSASLIWDEFEWKKVERSSRPSKMSKLPDFKLHSSQDDHPITKLLSTTNGDYKFGMEVPDAMISDAIKKKSGYNYFMAKKVESEKAKIVDEPEEQHVSPVKSGRGKGFMCYGDRVANVPNKLKKHDVPRKTRSLTIAKEAVVGQKLKGLTIDDPVVQLLLDLQIGSKASRLESLRKKKQPVAGEGSSAAHNKYYASLDTASDATLYSSNLDKPKGSANETNDADKSDMDLYYDNPQRDNDVARSSPKHNLTSSCNGSPSCALVKKYTISEFAEALTPL
ncbi:hypothetical protein Tco_0425076 [Tanacetum coccineum]